MRLADKSSRVTHSSVRELLAGIRAVLPLLVGVAPFGMIYGVLASAAGLPPAAAQAMSLLVFAGAAQFITVGLIATGAPGIIALLTTFVVNLRHVLYGASLAPHLQPLRPFWKWTLAFLLTDEAYALTISRYRQGARLTHWYSLGAGLLLYITWQVSTAVGILLGAQVPAAWGLEFTLPLTFIGLLVPTLTDRPSVGAALAAGIAAVLAAGLPLRLGLIIAAGVGIVTGILLDRGTLAPADRSGDRK